MLKNIFKKRKKIGLALGSGGVRGFAHIGVIEVLKENNIPIDYIAGTSIGAWVGANYALFQDLEKLKDMTIGNRKEKLACFWDLGVNGGLVKGNKIKNLLTKWLNGAKFSDTKIPFRAVTTDLITGKPTVFSSGPLVDAVQASMAIPSMFKPILHKEKILVDGGICNPVPADIVRKMGADIVIAVNLDNFQKNPWFQKNDTASITKVSGRSLDIMRHYLAEQSCKEADIVIEPRAIKSEAEIWKNYFWDGKGEEVVEAGRSETKAMIKKIKKMIND